MPDDALVMSSQSDTPMIDREEVCELGWLKRIKLVLTEFFTSKRLR